MLDLKPGIHFKEIEVFVAIDDELDRPGRAVADRLGQRHRLRAHRRSGLGVEKRARRFLDDLLVPTLDRAFALAEMHDMAVSVAEHLYLDVARLLDVFFEEHAVVAKARFGLVLGAGKILAQLDVVVGDAHALAAAAGRSLDHHRIADAVGDPGRLVRVGDDAEMAGHGRNPGGTPRASFDSILSPIAAIGLRGRDR